MNDKATMPDACSILIDAADAIAERAHQRDQPTGERSMGHTVRAFNAMFGTELTEHQGWQFMVMLKMARSTGGALRIDDYADGAAYFALAGESATRAQMTRVQADRNSAVAQSSIDFVRKLIVERRANRGRDL
jgi:hypothetical protein